MSNEIALIPKIVRGKKYLLHVKAIERICPLCGCVAGRDHDGEDYIVTILRLATNHWVCPSCDGRYIAPSEGWYQVAIDIPDTPMIGAPYTLLSQIEGVDYD